MKAYLIVTSALFGAITAAHLLRIFYEGPAVAADPWFVGLTALAVALCVWGLRLFARVQRGN